MWSERRSRTRRRIDRCARPPHRRRCRGALVIDCRAPFGPRRRISVVARHRTLLVGCLLGVVGVPRVARSRRVVALLCIAVLCLLGFVLGERANRSLLVDAGGPYTGWARVVDDPRSYRSSTWLLVEIDGDRHEVWLRRSSQRSRAESLQAGEHVMISGSGSRLIPTGARGSRGNTPSANCAPTGWAMSSTVGHWPAHPTGCAPSSPMGQPSSAAPEKTRCCAGTGHRR